MAPPPGTLRVGRYFLALLALMALLYALVFLPGERHTPKLGIDLVGGRSVIFNANAPQGKTPTASQMQQARQILQNRVNGSGVTQATVVIEGANRLNIAIPGGTNTDVSSLGKAAVLNFRGLIAPVASIACVSSTATSGSASPNTGTSPSAAPTKSGQHASPVSSSTAAKAPNDDLARPLTAPTKSAAKPTPKPTRPATSKSAVPSSVSAAPTSSAAPRPCLKDPFSLVLKQKSLKITSIPSTDDEYAALVKTNPTAVQVIAGALANYDCAATENEPDLPNHYYVACDPNGQTAYLLGKVIVPGNQIDSASAQAPNTANGSSTWSVVLNLKDTGANSWADWTSKYHTSAGGDPAQCGAAAGTPCSDYVGFTLDGKVISSPVTQSAINHKPTSITGSFGQKSANTLSDQLNYGALPLSFKLQLNAAISATLGADQLNAGLLAGGIGLILVVIYSLIYYRALGLVTIASLLVSAGLTYSMLVVLGKQIGFTLDLAGIAGFIVAIGITADSFVVFFERIKDEVHEGRSVRVAVPRAWVRARRTILSADTVSFLAAAILYYFAAGDVRGFAFTLGLSTILDLVVVFLFTHPIVSLLSRSRAFGSARFTGLDSVRDGGVVGGEPPRQARAARNISGRTGTAVLERPLTDTVAGPETLETALPDETGDDVGEPTHAPGKARPAGTAAERAAARRARMREQGSGEQHPGGDS